MDHATLNELFEAEESFRVSLRDRSVLEPFSLVVRVGHAVKEHK